jgi:hypothetical protein
MYVNVALDGSEQLPALSQILPEMVFTPGFIVRVAVEVAVTPMPGCGAGAVWVNWPVTVSPLNTMERVPVFSDALSENRTVTVSDGEV